MKRLAKERGRAIKICHEANITTEMSIEIFFFSPSTFSPHRHMDISQETLESTSQLHASLHASISYFHSVLCNFSLSFNGQIQISHMGLYKGIHLLQSHESDTHL